MDLSRVLLWEESELGSILGDFIIGRKAVDLGRKMLWL